MIVVDVRRVCFREQRYILFYKVQNEYLFFYSYKRYKNVYIKLLLFGNHLKKILAELPLYKGNPARISI